MSLNYNTELVLINTTTNSGTITLPSAITVPGRVISFKDNAGNFNNNSLTLICDGSDTFEDGTTQKVFYESFGSIQVVASGTKWYILSGVKQNAMTISSLITSTISTYSISFSDGSLQTISADKSINSSIIGLGTFGYISSTQLYSTVTGLIDSPEVQSTIIGLGTFGYLSSFNSISSLNISTGSLFSEIIRTQSISTINISSASNYTSFLFANSYNGTTLGGNINMNGGLFPTTPGNRDLGSSNARWNNFFVSTISSIHITTSTLQVQNTITASTINANNISGTSLSYQNISTNNITGFSLLGTIILSTQAIFCSSLQIGPADAILDILGPLRTQDLSTVTCQASSIVANTVTLNRIFGGPLVVNTTTTQNLYPFTIAAQIGFGTTVANLGFYNEGHFTSTFTRVIQPTLDTGSFSNIVTINGNISTPNIFSSTINSGTVTLTTGGFTQRIVSNAVAPSGTVTLNLTSGNVFYFTSAMGTSATANFTTASATVGSTYYVNFLTGATPGTVTFTGNTGATTLSITGLSLVGNPSVPIGLHGAGQSFTPNASTRYMFTCIAIAT
jgi:hypothetical protein